MRPLRTIAMFAAGVLFGAWLGFALARRHVASPVEARSAAKAETSLIITDPAHVAIRSDPAAHLAGLVHEIYATPSGLDRYYRFNKFLQQISRENWKTAHEVFEKARWEFWFTSNELMLCFERFGEVAGADFIEEATRVWDEVAAMHAIRGWAARDPVAAMAYLSRSPDNYLTKGLVPAIAPSNPEAALKIFARLPADYQYSYIADIAKERSLTHFVTLWLGSSTQLKFPNKDFDPSYIFGTMAARNRENKTTAEMLSWLDQYTGQPYAAADRVSDLPGLLTDPDLPFNTSANWLTRFSGHAPESAKSTFVGVFSRTKYLAEAAMWLDANPNHPMRDHAVEGLVRNLANTQNADMSGIERWVSTIRDGEIRARAGEILNKRVTPP